MLAGPRTQQTPWKIEVVDNCLLSTLSNGDEAFGIHLKCIWSLQAGVFICKYIFFDFHLLHKLIFVKY